MLILDDVALELQESRDTYDLFLERDRAASILVTSNRGPNEWFAVFAAPTRAQGALNRFTSNTYDLVRDDES